MDKRADGAFLRSTFSAAGGGTSFDVIYTCVDKYVPDIAWSSESRHWKGIQDLGELGIGIDDMHVFTDDAFDLVEGWVVCHYHGNSGVLCLLLVSEKCIFILLFRFGNLDVQKLFRVLLL